MGLPQLRPLWPGVPRGPPRQGWDRVAGFAWQVFDLAALGAVGCHRVSSSERRGSHLTPATRAPSPQGG